MRLGRARPARGALCVARSAWRWRGVQGLSPPKENAAEAAVEEGISVYPVDTLTEAAGIVTGQVQPEPFELDLGEVSREASRTHVVCS